MLELESWIKTGNYRLRPSLILRLHGILLDRLSNYPGVYRPADIVIKGSRHEPPPASYVPRLIEDLCDYVNENWDKRSAVHLSAFILWRLNWIHAFVDGNGRTARIVSYLVLCAHSKVRLPGDLTIPEQISRNKQPYYEALESADRAAKKGKIELAELEDLIGAHLANQLYDFHLLAVGKGKQMDQPFQEEIMRVLRQAQKEGVKDRGAVVNAPARPRPRNRTLAWIEAHPALVTLFGTLLTAVLALIALFFGK